MSEESWGPYDWRRAFVLGAKWWEWKKEGATMWPADRRLAEAEARKAFAELEEDAAAFSRVPIAPRGDYYSKIRWYAGQTEIAPPISYVWRKWHEDRGHRVRLDEDYGGMFSCSCGASFRARHF